MKILMFALVFFFIGAFFIISDNNLYLNNSDDIGLFFESYAGWLDGLFAHGKIVTGYLVKMEWLPEN